MAAIGESKLRERIRESQEMWQVPDLAVLPAVPKVEVPFYKTVPAELFPPDFSELKRKLLVEKMEKQVEWFLTTLRVVDQSDPSLKILVGMESVLPFLENVPPTISLDTIDNPQQKVSPSIAKEKSNEDLKRSLPLRLKEMLYKPPSHSEDPTFAFDKETAQDLLVTAAERIYKNHFADNPYPKSFFSVFAYLLVERIREEKKELKEKWGIIEEQILQVDDGLQDKIDFYKAEKREEKLRKEQLRNKTWAAKIRAFMQQNYGKKHLPQS